MGRGLTILLIISLAANVFLGGFIAGRLIGGPPHHPQMMPLPGELGGRGAFRELGALTPDEREAFRAVFKTKRDDIRKEIHEALALRKAFGDALAADPWDRAEAEKALAELSAAEGARLTALSTLLIDAFEDLPADKRKALIEEATKRGEEAWRPRGKHRRGRGLDRDGPPPEGAGPQPDDEGPPPAPPADEETAPPPD